MRGERAPFASPHPPNAILLPFLQAEELGPTPFPVGKNSWGERTRAVRILGQAVIPCLDPLHHQVLDALLTIAEVCLALDQMVRKKMD
ncbi:hypothetical protein NDU88_000855 [Pleurodeles waltl]|uniref:Uncharacterized protein n=1 Tax=Pleurodeles waltl TaxID=8319 RepID=A0AAV7SB93_PLEWA|nr:hypothetical protein NDU88_000855 [Pleurodeles waltl]